MIKLWRLLPLTLFLLLSVFLYRGLYLNPRELPSVLINQQAPALNLPILNSVDKFSVRHMRGKVWLLNVWATWCMACQEEHPVMMDIANENVTIIGMDYKDEDKKAADWLKQYGSPYQAVILDKTGERGIDWGVYGAPETFILDKKGRIRYKHLGVITHDIWQKQLKPIYVSLEREAAG